jgi:uncharacterized protein (TIGR02594 family)
MPILDSQGNPLPPRPTEETTPRPIKGRIAAIAAFVAAVALFVGNIDKLWSTASGWISGKKDTSPTVVVQITSEGLLKAAQQITAGADKATGPEKAEAEQAAQNLNAAASKLASPISLNSDAEKSPAWLLTAMKELGQQEIGGEQHNQRILEYIRSVTPSMAPEGDEIPWTSFFVNWALTQSGIEGTNSGAARSWLNWGIPLEQPKLGAVAVFERGGNPMSGHVGLYLGDAGDYVLCVAGNVGNAVRINAVPKSRLLGYRWPKTT